MAAAVFREALPILPVKLAVTSRPGQPDIANAGAVIASIERATSLAVAGEVAAVVTNPISKGDAVRRGLRASRPYRVPRGPDRARARPVMMLASPMLRVVPVTIHVSLRRAIELLTVDEIVETVRITASGLRRDFAIAHPRIAPLRP